MLPPPQVVAELNNKIVTESGEPRDMVTIGRTPKFTDGVATINLSDLFTTVTSVIAQMSSSTSAYFVAGCGISGTTVNVLARRADTGDRANVEVGIRLFVVGVRV